MISTTEVWADVATRIACDGSVAVATLIPPGADPHTFEPSLADRAELDESALVLVAGYGLEGPLVGTLDSVAADGTPVLVVADAIGEFRDGADAIDDPHLWLDIGLVMEALDPIADALVDEAGLSRQTADRCAAEYRAELEAVDADIARLMDPIPEADRLLVTSHDVLRRFAERYGLVVVGSVRDGSSSATEVNPRRLGDLLDLLDETGVCVVFSEAGRDVADIAALAREAGDLEVVALRPASSGPGGQGSYIDLIEDLAGAIAVGLEC